MIHITNMETELLMLQIILSLYNPKIHTPVHNLCNSLAG